MKFCPLLPASEPDQIAEEYVPHVASGLKSLIDVRKPGADGSPPLMDSSRFIDVKFNQLMKDPMGEVRNGIFCQQCDFFLSVSNLTCSLIFVLAGPTYLRVHWSGFVYYSREGNGTAYD